MGYPLRNCSDSDQVIYTDSDLSAFVERFVTIIGQASICWVVEPLTADTGSLVEVVDCFLSCEDCQRVFYRLTDCTGRVPDLYTEQEQFADLVGRVVKVPYYDNACFTITEVPFDNTRDRFNIEIFKDYTTCFECAERKSVEPGYSNDICDTDKIEKVQGAFSHGMYQDMISKRYGIEVCCQQDMMKLKLNNRLLELQLMNVASPDLPEPVVLDCCIETDVPTQVSNCDPIEQEAQDDDCPCNCKASVDSPHDCHTYNFSVTAQMLTFASGNTDTALNGRVYFGYYPCGETDAVTVRYTAETLDVEYCVLGQPILGWHLNNNWVSAPDDTLIRGEICEQEEETNNC